jgi:plasmid stabilization system protein ParE
VVACRKIPAEGHQLSELRKILVPFGKSSYIIHYAILDEEVLILRVYNGRQNRPT